jgi:hypothetical protein
VIKFDVEPIKEKLLNVPFNPLIAVELVKYGSSWLSPFVVPWLQL